MKVPEIAQLLIDVEYAIRDLYQICARTFPLTSQAFLKLAEEEEDHARILKEMAEKIKTAPEGWGIGNFDGKIIKTLIDSIRLVCKDVEDKKIPDRCAFTRLRGFEESMLEQRPELALQHPDEKLTKPLKAISDGYSVHAKRLREIEISLWGKPQPLDQRQPPKGFS